MGYLAEVQILLQSGTDPNYANDLGETSLHLAAISESPGIVSALIRAGADLNRATVGGAVAVKENRTPLMWFASSCQKGGVKALLDANAKVNVMNEQGVTVLDLISRFDGDNCDAVRKLLIKKGAKSAVDVEKEL
mmetsp:Transcript_40079/g.64615  ORF Transcript_40079/g.64615 Transcript_40079/m.64615 type:complete len:135 (-) Transcript_40079:97-501(-)